jgi:CheY-like chemotaxis protein
MTLEHSASHLAGQRVFLVEDESLLIMMLEDFLEEFGCEVTGTASRVPAAMEKAKSLLFDVAILDVNVDGENTFPIGELLLQRKIPFIFATGYGNSGIPEHLRGAPVLKKPFQQQDLEKALCSVLCLAP